MKILKLSFVALVVTMLAVACNKSSDQTNSEVSELAQINDDGYDETEAPEIVEESEPITLEERAASPAPKVNSVSNSTLSTLAASDACHNIKHEGYWIVPNTSATNNWNFSGENLSLGGAGSVASYSSSKGSVTGVVKVLVKQSGTNKFADTLTCTTTNWTSSSIGLNVAALNKPVLGTFSMKFIFEIPALKSDSTPYLRKKTYTVKCIGKDFAGARFNTFDYIVNSLAKNGNSLKLPTGFSVVNGNSAITAAPNYGTFANLVTDSTNLTPLKVGDIVQRADGSTGLVYGVTARDPKKGMKVRIQQIKCDKASIKAGTWTFVHPAGFKAKTDEASGTWTKFKVRTE